MLKPQFHVDKFEELLLRRGTPIFWERSRLCPRWDPRTHSPLSPCPLCHGTGYLYTPMGTYHAAVLGIMGSKQWARFGEWLSGDAVMTFPSRLLISDKDRITLTEREYQESVVLVKGSRDTLQEPKVFDIVECGDEHRLYTFGRDFVLEGATIVWRGSQPAAGQTYTLRYRANISYVVWQTLPQVRARNSSGEMPKKVALRRWLDFVPADGSV